MYVVHMCELEYSHVDVKLIRWWVVDFTVRD